jgi:hypothetical protein
MCGCDSPVYPCEVPHLAMTCNSVTAGLDSAIYGAFVASHGGSSCRGTKIDTNLESPDCKWGFSMMEKRVRKVYMTAFEPEFRGWYVTSSSLHHGFRRHDARRIA